VGVLLSVLLLLEKFSACLGDHLSLSIALSTGLLSEGQDSIEVLLDEGGELVRQVDQIVRVDVATLVVLTVPHDGVASQELLVKQDYHFVVCVTDNRSSKSKRHILSSV
jgi:hypothetical protein